MNNNDLKWVATEILCAMLKAGASHPTEHMINAAASAAYTLDKAVDRAAQGQTGTAAG